MANATHHGNTNTALTVAGTTLTINVPTVSNGDLMLLWLCTAVATTGFTLSGWTLLEADPSGAGTDTAYLYYRWASSEPASYAPTWTTSSEAIAVMHTYSNVDPVDPFIYASIQRSTVSVATATMWSMKQNASTCMVASFIFWGRGSVTTTQPTSYTMAGNPDSAGNDTTSGEGAGAYITLTSAQDAAVVTWTSSNGTTHVGATVGIRANDFQTRAVALRGIGIMATNATAGITPALPTLHRSGSLLIAIVGQAGATSPTMTAPGGWTQIGSLQAQSTSSLGVWYKIDGGSETDPTFTWSTAPTKNNAIILEVDYASASPVLAFAQASDSVSNTAFTFPAITLAAQNPGYLLIAIVQLLSNSSNFATATGYTNTAFDGAPAAGFDFAVGMSTGTGANPATGNFGGGTSRTNVAFHIAIGQKAKLKVKAAVWA